MQILPSNPGLTMRTTPQPTRLSDGANCDSGGAPRLHPQFTS